MISPLAGPWGHATHRPHVGRVSRVRLADTIEHMLRAFVLTLLLCQAAWAAVPDLTEAQRIQLGTATDRVDYFDEAALYPLLTNAVEWDPNASEAGAMVPDYEAMRTDPDKYRGQLFLIEGLFGGVPKDETSLVGPLQRPGAWDGKLQRWGIETDPQTEHVVAVLLVGAPPPPRAGMPVRLTARFYKVWQIENRNGQPTDYLLFVGKTAHWRARAGGASGEGYGSTVLVGVLVAAAGAFLFLLRRSFRLTLTPKPLPGQLRRREREVDAEPDEQQPAEPLPAMLRS